MEYHNEEAFSMKVPRNLKLQNVFLFPENSKMYVCHNPPFLLFFSIKKLHLKKAHTCETSDILKKGGDCIKKGWTKK